MKYTQSNNTSKSILHQFTKDKNITHYIGGKKWEDICMSFREIKTNSDKRKFGFVIRYGNPEYKEWQLNQFDMDENEIKQFLDIVYETVYNPPKFKDDYCVGDKFILPKVTIIKAQNDDYQKETIYTNVRAEIMDIQDFGVKYYMIKFDDASMIVKQDYLDKLKKI
jgi:hypothetical protein